MIDIPLSLRVLPQGRYNRGIYTCYECGFEPPHYNVVPCMLGLARDLCRHDGRLGMSPVRAKMDVPLPGAECP